LSLCNIIGYDIFLTKWFGDALPIEQQSLEIIRKLKLAAVGTRPIIFVTHSFGGLVTKEMLRFASENEDYKSILDNTLGIVFYSTPHRGSALTRYASSLHLMVRGTAAMQELQPDSKRLAQLNKLFPEYAGNYCCDAY
jgi:hypothetical protein